MDRRKIAGSVSAVLTLGLLFVVLSALLAPEVRGALVQLKNDNNTAGGYSSTWQAGDMIGAVLTPEDYMYPVRVSSVEFVLYNGFPGADDSVTVRVCIYSLDGGQPDVQLGCSGSQVISTFAPSLVSVSLDSSEIVIDSPDSFLAAVEYLTGVMGQTPSTLTDTSTDIPEGKNFYSLDGGSTWYEHYDFWAEPSQVGYNIIRATVDTNYGLATPTRMVAPTRTLTPIVPPTQEPTPVPQATPYPCLPWSPDHLCYLPLVLKEWQEGTPYPPTPPLGAEFLGIRGYWPYVSMMVGDHELLVNVGNGNLLLGYVDQAIPAPGIDSVLMRTFNALSPYQGEFGRGWTSNVGNSLRLAPRADGSVVFFGASGEIEVIAFQAGEFISPKGFHSTLEQKAGGTYTLTSIADGIELRFTAQGRLSSAADRNGNTQTYRRDGAGRVVEIVDSVGESTNLAYGGMLVTGVRDRAGRESEYRYDTDGRLTQYVNPAGHTTEYRYDDCDDLTAVVDANGYLWTFGYDSEGRVVLITDPLGGVTQFSYQEGQTILTDANGHNTIYRYDADGKLLERIDANGHSVQFAWDPYFNLTGITSPLGHETRLSWQGNTGLLTSIAEPIGSKVSTTGGIEPSPNSRANAGSNAVFYTYDANHNLTAITDPRNNVTRFEYDARGANLLRVSQADGSQMTFTYDSRGNPLTLTDPNGNAGDPSNPTGIPYRFAYDSYGFLTDVYDPLDYHWTYLWDQATGNLLGLQDAKNQLTLYTYDILDRLTGIAYADGMTVTYRYDALGDLTSIADGHGTTAYTNDAVGQLRTEDDPRTEGLHQYDYDAVGNLIQITRDSGAVLTFSYDQADRLISQSNPFDGGQLITYRYDADDRLLDSFYPNGDQTSYSYCSNGWLESLLTTAEDSTVYDWYRFLCQAEGGYDANGNPLEITRSIAIFDEYGVLDWTSDTWRMRYDALDQMTQQDGYDADDTWRWRVTLSYNPNGLWSTRTYEDSTQFQSWDYHYDAASRWTGITFWDGRRDVVINDASGNQTEIREEFLSGSGIVTHTTAFEYDAADRLVRVTDPEENWYAVAWDGFNRIRQVNSSWFDAPKSQYYDSLGVAREVQGSAAVDYVRDLGGALRSYAIEGLLPYYVHRDPRRQITHISDDDGLKVYYDYCFMGNVQGGGAASGAPIYAPFLSTGRYSFVLDGAWQAGILYDDRGGDFWPHNSQVSLRNQVAAPDMRPRSDSPSRNPFWHEFWRLGGWFGTEVEHWQSVIKEIVMVYLLELAPYKAQEVIRGIVFASDYYAALYNRDSAMLARLWAEEIVDRLYPRFNSITETPRVRDESLANVYRRLLTSVLKPFAERAIEIFWARRQ